MTYKLSFHDQAGRNHMSGFKGHEADFNHLEDLLNSLLDNQHN